MNDDTLSTLDALREQVTDAKREVTELRAALDRQLRLTAVERLRAEHAEDAARRAVRLAVQFSRR